MPGGNMKTSFLAIIIFLAATAAMAAQYQAILYCNFRAPSGEEIKEHWKPEIPNVGIDEVIRDFRLLEKQGAKRVYHALVDTSSGEDGQVGRIKEHIRTLNGCEAPVLQGPECTTPVGQQILAWWAKDADTMYKRLWQDRATHAIFETIAKSILRYPVETTCDGEPCTLIVSVADAETTYSETIDPQKLMIPHRFYGK
jgi:hypothetical protein